MQFDETYFERGRSTGVSMYEGYRWMPERSLVEAHWFVVHAGVSRSDKIIDYGCAKGFFVKAMRLLGYSAWGYDTSTYAIGQAEIEAVPYVSTEVWPTRFDAGFCKDVLEHCETIACLNAQLKIMRTLSTRWLIVVPTGKNGRFDIGIYGKDVTHHLKLTACRWGREIERAGLKIASTSLWVPGIKENWTTRFKTGNLFIRTE